MSSSLVINEKKYHKIKIASKQFGYSSDYITRLARSQKILAVQINRRWHVSLDSFEQYIEAQKIEQQARQSQIRVERQQELALRTSLAQLADNTQQTSRHGHILLFSVATCMMVLGVWFGLSAVSPLVDTNMAASVYNYNSQAASDDRPGQTEALTPLFFENRNDVVVSDDRAVAKPAMDDQWVMIAYE